MKIGLMIATEGELEAFLKSGEGIRKETRAGKKVYITEMEGHEVIAGLSGYGEVDAAAITMLLIAGYGCEVIMNFGVAGALETDLRVEDLFAVEKAWHYDYDVSELEEGKKIGQYAEYADEFIPLDAGLLKTAEELIPEIRRVTAASGDKFVTRREEKIRLRNAGCGICEMEVGAIARVCSQSGVRCLSIKCISDTFEGGAGDFYTNVTRSAEKAFGAIRAILKKP